MHNRRLSARLVGTAFDVCHSVFVPVQWPVRSLTTVGSQCRTDQRDMHVHGWGDNGWQPIGHQHLTPARSVVEYDRLHRPPPAMQVTDGREPRQPVKPANQAASRVVCFLQPAIGP
jgi:hypothetical protein